MEENEANEDRITIDRVELGTGWVCFEGGETPPPADQLPLYLNDAFCTWISRNSEFRVRSVLPIVVNGNTVAIHVWFE